MSDTRPRVRLRQAVILAEDLEVTARSLRGALGLGEPFRDPGVGEFGLANAVFAIGDCFLEVISPQEPGTAAGRWLERRGGDGGYMVIFDLEDLEGGRARAAGLGVRVVWQIDLSDISGTHLHPADVGGVILSLDRSNPYGSWRWGGPQWTGLIASPAPGALKGISVAVKDPAAVAGRWGEVLGVEVEPVARSDAETTDRRLSLDGGEVRFEAADRDGDGLEGIVEIALELPRELPGGGETVEVGGVRLRRVRPKPITAARGALAGELSMSSGELRAQAREAEAQAESHRQKDD